MRQVVHELGDHRLLQGDAFDSYAVDQLIGSEKPAMLYCDPPYGMNLNTDWSQMGEDMPYRGMTRGHKYAPVLGDDRPFNPAPIIQRFNKVPEQFWWGADYYSDMIPDRLKGSWVVWDKRLTESADKIWGSSFELCWSRKRHKRDFARIKWAGLFGLEKEPERRRLHPTQKPIALAEWFITRYTKPGDIVVDLFAGSGSTLLACERTGRRCRTMEIAAQHHRLIMERFEAFTRIGVE